MFFLERDSFEFFNYLLGVHGRIFGSISNDLVDGEDKFVIDYLGAESNYVVRMESSCYYNSSIEYITLLNKHYDCNYISVLLMFAFIL